MKKTRTLLAALWTGMLALQAGAASAQPAVLNPKHCQALPSHAVLPADWEKYRAAVRACPLVGSHGGARVRLLSVFVDEYYRGLPADAPWEAFPRAMIVDAEGRCLSRLAHLFPSEPPSAMRVTLGKWQQGLPTEIRFRVSNPAVSGDYSLPTLTWNPRTQTYQPAAASRPHDKEKTLCP